MAKSSAKSMLSGSVWGIFGKLFDAVAKFVTIPLLVAYYGKADYGLIALAFSLNAYLRLMDMGMNVGSIRFFSLWISKKEWEKIGAVSKSSIVFYGVIGIVNASIFVVMAQVSANYFRLTAAQTPIFQWMMYILAFSTIFNWTSNVLSQLLTAAGEQGWINRANVLSSALLFASAFLAIWLKLSLPVYFLLYTLSTLMTIPLNVYKLRVFNMPLLKLIAPKWDGKAFREILSYSVAIFGMGLFQFSADNLRPILLGKYASKGIEVLTEYRVIQTITALVIAFGGVFLQVLLPSATKVYSEGNQAKIENLVYKGTKYVSVFLCFVVFILAINSKLLLVLYMGKSYGDLSIWLIIWLFTVLLSMHDAPVASMVLSTGKTKPLVYMSAVSCLVTLPITAILAPHLNVGAAVIGFFVYVLMQEGFYYIYYLPRVLNLSGAIMLFKSFLPSLIAGAMGWGVVYLLQLVIHISSGIVCIIFNSLIFGVVYLLLIVLFVIKVKEIRELKSKLL